MIESDDIPESVLPLAQAKRKELIETLAEVDDELPFLASIADLVRVHDDFEQFVAGLDLDAPWPGAAADGPRGRAGSERRVVLPDGWLDTQELTAEQAAWVAEAEAENSGG